MPIELNLGTPSASSGHPRVLLLGRTDRPMVFVCSPFERCVQENVQNARRYSRFAYISGYMPITPHLMYPRFLDDRKIAKHVHNSIPVLHWFTGTDKEALQAIDLGCWFSIGPAMLSSSSGRRIACLLPLDRVLPETDGPFATKNFLPLMPWDVTEVYQFLEEQHYLNQDVIEETIQNNLERMESTILDRQAKF